MIRLNIPLILDTFLCFVCAFFLSFTAIRFYTQNTLLGLFSASLCAVAVGFASFLYISKKQNKNSVFTFEQKRKKLLMAHLALSSFEYINVLFLRLFGKDAKTSNGKILVNGDTLFFNFKFEPLNLDDVAPVIKSTEENKILYCNEVSEQAKELLSAFEIKVCDATEIYNLLKRADLLPENYLLKEKTRQSLVGKIKGRFNKKLSIPLFWSGIAMLFFSYFTFFPAYYITVGAILIILCICAVIFGKTSKT